MAEEFHGTEDLILAKLGSVSSVDDQDQMTWLRSRGRPGDDSTGYRIDTGWEDSAWILHSIYVNDFLALRLTPDLAEVRHRYGSVGRTDEDVRAYEAAFGPESEFSHDPDAELGWRRVSWSQFASMLDLDPFPERRPPSFRYFSGRATDPRASLGPSEGTMDGDQFVPLMEHLADHSENGADELCYCFFAMLAAWRTDFQDTGTNPVLSRAPLGEIASRLRGQTPSNIWPDNRSWFVYTDIDLSGTRVSGSHQLIEDLLADPVLDARRIDVRWYGEEVEV